MTSPTRIAVFGTQALRDAIATCGYEPADDGALAVVDATDPDSMARASALPALVPRVIVAPAALHASLRAFGADPDRIVADTDAATVGPVIARLLPAQPRHASRVIVITGVRGGVGRTLLATNLARRLAPASRVCVVDATGSGAAAWWLRTTAASWSSLEGLADEMSPDHLTVVAQEAAPGLQLIGGGYGAPSASIARATVRAASAAHEIVVVDAPQLNDDLAPSLSALADRRLVLTYDDPLCIEAVSASVADGDWLIGAQTTRRKIGAHDVFRALPRDESAIAGALASRDIARGKLGRAYDELAEIIAIDAS